MDLYIRSVSDLPHKADDDPYTAACGVSLVGAKKITDAQALKFLGDERCGGCFPNWSHKKRYETRG
jgi:hypothetical protein